MTRFSELARIFLLDDFRENLKNGVLVDLYYYTIQFARDHKFKKEQASAFFSLVKRTHEVCTGEKACCDFILSKLSSIYHASFQRLRLATSVRRSATSENCCCAMQWRLGL